MCWFSHRHRTGRQQNCMSYLLTGAKDDSPNIKHPLAAAEWARPLLLHAVYSKRIPFICTWGVSAVLSTFFCPRWPWPLTSIFKLGRDFCTMYLTTKFHHPTFNHSEVVVLTNKLTNRRCWKHPPCSAMLRQWIKIVTLFTFTFIHIYGTETV